jgi:hypothetical protein
LESQNLKQKLIDALHEGLGGDGWASSSSSYDEKCFCSEKLENALARVLKVLQDHKKSG